MHSNTCYCVLFSETLITLNTLHGVHGTHFTAESTEVMRIKCLAQGHSILLPGFEPSKSSSRNRHSNHMTNILYVCTTCTTCITTLIDIETAQVEAKYLLYIYIHGKKYTRDTLIPTILLKNATFRSS